MIDTHCHLEQPDYDKDRHLIIEKCRKSLQAIITSCANPMFLNLTFQLVRKYKGFVFATASIHPSYVKKFNDEEIKQYIKCIKSSKDSLVAIGETGLDYNWVKESKWQEKQKKIAGPKDVARSSWLFMFPGIVFNLIFGWYPLILGLIVAFQSYHLIRPPVFSGLDNFTAIFQLPLFPIVYRNTFYYTFLSLTLTFLIPIIVAILLMEMKKSTIRIMMILWFIPVSSMASLVIWKWFYNPQYGLFNAILNGLGFPSLRWLNDPDLAMICLIIPGLMLSRPFCSTTRYLFSLHESFQKDRRKQTHE